MNKNLYKPLKKYPKYYDFLQSFNGGYNQLKDKNNLLPTLAGCDDDDNGIGTNLIKNED